MDSASRLLNITTSPSLLNQLNPNHSFIEAITNTVVDVLVHILVYGIVLCCVGIVLCCIGIPIYLLVGVCSELCYDVYPRCIDFLCNLCSTTKNDTVYPRNALYSTRITGIGGYKYSKSKDDDSEV